MALLKYLADTSTFEPALAVIRWTQEELLKHPQECTSANEALQQAKASLLKHHIEAGRPYKPSIVRSSTAEGIALFPNNTILLSLYAWNERRFRIDDRVRSIMRDTMRRTGDRSIISHLFAVSTELKRPVSSGSTAHSGRAAFERALESQVGKASAALWTRYFYFELRQGDKERIKNVFYRGMRALPWLKAFYMLAFEHMRDILSFNELKKIYEVMVEKELRIHVDLEDAFHDVEERQAQKLKGSSGRHLPIAMPVDDDSSFEDK